MDYFDKNFNANGKLTPETLFIGFSINCFREENLEITNEQDVGAKVR